jgi:hypothetical protein
VSPRTVILAVALVFTCAMAFGTVYVLIDQGPDVLTLLGVLITLLFAVGILGALTERD